MAPNVETIRLLLRAADIDTVYRSSYLWRARELMNKEFPAADYQRLVELRSRLAKVASDAERAVEAGQWDRVRQLAQGAAAREAELQERRDLLEIADNVYRSDPVVLSPFADPLAGGESNRPAANLDRMRAEIINNLVRLESLDATNREFYAKRRHDFAELSLAVAQPQEESDPERQAEPGMRSAIQSHDWGRLAELANSLSNLPSMQSCRASRMPDSALPQLADPWPKGSETSAAALGFEPVLLPEEEPLIDYFYGTGLSRGHAPEHALGRETRAQPPDTRPNRGSLQLDQALRETLEFLMVRPIISSVGVRYLPQLRQESILVEGFPEHLIEESSPLLERLELRRRGLSRLEIERATHENGARILAELALDPHEFALVCIPFDAYLRLAPSRGWGRAPLWTHFDGYQLLRDRHLRALVGGDLRYGGHADLCSIGRAYAPPHIIARFAIVRRLRMRPTAA